jgi:hypothetical protein
VLRTVLRLVRLRATQAHWQVAYICLNFCICLKTKDSVTSNMSTETTNNNQSTTTKKTKATINESKSIIANSNLHHSRAYWYGCWTKSCLSFFLVLFSVGEPTFSHMLRLASFQKWKEKTTRKLMRFASKHIDDFSLVLMPLGATDSYL